MSSNAFFSARSSLSRSSQILPSYMFQSVALNEVVAEKGERKQESGAHSTLNNKCIEGLSSLNSERVESEATLNLPKEERYKLAERPIESNVVYYKPVYPNTGGPIYNSISTTNSEYKERLNASANIRRAHSQLNWRSETVSPTRRYISLQNGDLCLFKSCEYPRLNDYYKICNIEKAIPEKIKINQQPSALENGKVLRSISKNIIQKETASAASPSSTCPSSPEKCPNKEKELKSMFSIKSLERKQESNEAKQNELINEFRKSPTISSKQPYTQSFVNEGTCSVKCMNNACSNIKGALNTLELTGKAFLDIIIGIASVFDLDQKEVNSDFNFDERRFNNLEHFPVSSIDIPPNNVVLQCFDCGAIYYAELPLNKQQLSTIGVLDPQPVEFGLPGNADDLEFEIRNRNSPHYCWGNLQPRDLSPSQIEFIKTKDLGNINKFSLQDIVDLYYYRYRRDRRYDHRLPTFVLSDPQLHLYRFYREVMHGVYNGGKTPLPELVNCHKISPWFKDMKDQKCGSPHLNHNRYPNAEYHGNKEPVNGKFERDEHGFTILPTFDSDEANQSNDEYTRIIYSDDNSHIYPFILDKFMS